MDIAPFFYRILKVTKGDNSGQLLGTAFPITPNGGFITCRHVIDVHTTDHEHIAIYDNETRNIVPIDQSSCLIPKNKSHDLAFIPNALQRKKEEFFPLLSPLDVITGEDVYSYGYFLSSSSEFAAESATSINQGVFKGNIVNFSNSPKTPGSMAISLSYPIVEGLSGSPVLTYHHGPKVVGMCYGNVQSRVTASEVLEYRDEVTEYKEIISRIVEFGRAHHVAGIVSYLQETSVTDFIVSSQSVNLDFLRN